MEDHRLTFDFSLKPRNGYLIYLTMDGDCPYILKLATKYFGTGSTYRSGTKETGYYMVFSGNVQDMDEQKAINKLVAAFDKAVQEWIKENKPELQCDISVYWE